MRCLGFTLAELLVTVVLFGTVATGAVSVLIAGQRVYSRQIDLMNANATKRAATNILTSELRGLDPAAPSGSDLLSVSTGSVTYRATRSMYITCAPPDLSRSTVLLHGDYLGSRHLDPRSIPCSCLPTVTRRHRRTIDGCTPICDGSTKDTAVRTAARAYRSTSRDYRDVTWNWLGLERPCEVRRSGRSEDIRTRGASGGSGCVVTASPPTSGLPFSHCWGRSRRMDWRFNTSTLTVCQPERPIELQLSISPWPSSPHAARHPTQP